MSVQFGRWNFDGEPVDLEYLDRVRRVLAPFGPDGCSSYSKNNVSMLYHPFHTTKESRGERQPHVSRSNAVITWDGRLDNRSGLIRDLALVADATDVEIVAAGYDKWGDHCFARLTGDWALAIWDVRTRSLILAKDFVGVRHLYYSLEGDRVTWSTVLDPIVLFSKKAFALEEEYIAGWLAFCPASDLTPFTGIHAVPASSFVRIESGRPRTSSYWDFTPARGICYRSDIEYEEHFRTVFSESVRRRLRSDAPVLAELSGGMDSSSVVCVADKLIEQERSIVPRLDTISYFDDSEPNWNERPYFNKVEDQRGRTGWHVDVGAANRFRFDIGLDRFSGSPGDALGDSGIRNDLSKCLASHGNRVVLSGTGGDEVNGGVPTPVPELADLLLSARFGSLARQLRAWALNKRKPWFHLLLETVRRFLPPTLAGVAEQRRPAPWLAAAFSKRNRLALTGYEHRLKLFGSRPSFQQSLRTLDALRRQLESEPLAVAPIYEKRYPYLDRDLLEFLYAIPREQLVRPGQRRCLVRRAFRGIVPDEVLDRKRKAFVIRAPMAAIASVCATWRDASKPMISSSLGILDRRAFVQALEKASRGELVSTIALMRTLALEAWLQSVLSRELKSNGLPVVVPELQQAARDLRVVTNGQFSAEISDTEKGGEQSEIREAATQPRG